MGLISSYLKTPYLGKVPRVGRLDDKINPQGRLSSLSRDDSWEIWDDGTNSRAL